MMDYYDPNDHWLHRQSDDMNDDDRMKAAIMQCAVFLILLIVGLVLCALLGSCSTTERVVTVEKVRTDTVWQNHTARDSIFVHDSVHVKEKSDTVWIEKWKTVWQNHTKHDSIYIHKTDSVPVPYPVVKEVEKPLTATQKGLMVVGLLAVMVGVVWVAWRLKRWLP